MALRSLGTLEQDSIIQLAVSLEGRPDLAMESAMALLACDAGHHPAVLEVAAGSKAAARTRSSSARLSIRPLTIIIRVGGFETPRLSLDYRKRRRCKTRADGLLFCPGTAAYRKAQRSL
jgi:hypothetical protein